MSKYLKNIELRRGAKLSVGNTDTLDVSLNYDNLTDVGSINHGIHELITLKTDQVAFNGQIQVGGYMAASPVNGMLAFDGVDFKVYMSSIWETVAMISDIPSVNIDLSDVTSNGNITTDDIIVGSGTKNVTLSAPGASLPIVKFLDAGTTGSIEFDGTNDDFTISHELKGPSYIAPSTDNHYVQRKYVQNTQFVLGDHGVTELQDVTSAGSGIIITAAERTKLNGIATGAEVNVQSDWSQSVTTEDSYILNKPTDLTDLSSHNVTELADVTSAGSGMIVTSAERTAWNAKIDSTEKGQVNGVAELDASGKVPVAQLPDSVLGGLNYIGTWNASTNTPNISATSPNKGDFYKVSVAGSTDLDGITDWKVGDWAIYNGTTWDKIDQTDDVNSVNGQTGVVSLDADDISDASTTNKYVTTAILTKITGIENGAEVNVKSDWNEASTTDDSYIQNKPTIPAAQVNSDWSAGSGIAEILNKPTDITDLSTHSVTELSDVTSVGSGIIITATERTKLNGIATGAEVNVKSDWNQASSSADDFILNKPIISEFTVDTTHTTNNLLNLLSTITLDTNKTSIIKVNVTGYGNGEWAAYEFRLIVSRGTGAPVIQLENEVAADDSFGNNNDGIEFGISTNNITVSVKSDNAVGIDWTNKYTVI